MAETIQILKPKEPLKRGDKYIFPLTSTDQILISGKDGLDSDRLTLANMVKQDIAEAEIGEASLVNADTLGGDITKDDVVSLQKIASNPNLLDNPWFINPVNQRGVTTWQGGYGIDRWVSTASVTMSNAGLYFRNTSANQGLYQKIEGSRLVMGEKYTLSVLLTTDVLMTKTFTLSERVSGNYIEGIVYKYEITKNTSDNTWAVWVAWMEDANTSINIKAVKLERGEHSTLRNDSAPDYATEFLKCRRYCKVLIPILNNPFAVGLAYDANSVRFSIETDVPMRAKPTVTVTDKTAIHLFGDSGYQQYLTNVSISSSPSDSSYIDFVCTPNTAVTQGKTYHLFSTINNNKIVLSAEL